MASVSINVGRLRERPNAEFSSVSTGNFESLFLKNLVYISELEPKADNCTKLMVWHTQTKKSISNIDFNGDNYIMNQI